MTEINELVIENFFQNAELGLPADKAKIEFLLQSAEDLRSDAASLSLTEAFLGYKLESETFNRSSIKQRLVQRMRGRALQLIDEFFEQLEDK